MRGPKKNYWGLSKEWELRGSVNQNDTMLVDRLISWPVGQNDAKLVDRLTSGHVDTGCNG